MTSKSIRVDDETFDRLHALAEEEDRPMSRIVRGSVELYDQVKLAKATKRPEIDRVPDQGPGGESAPDMTGTGELGGSDLRSPQEPGRCPPHPKDRLRKLTWGTLCGLCGAVVK